MPDPSLAPRGLGTKSHLAAAAAPLPIPAHCQAFSQQTHQALAISSEGEKAAWSLFTSHCSNHTDINHEIGERQDRKQPRGRHTRGSSRGAVPNPAGHLSPGSLHCASLPHFCSCRPHSSVPGCAVPSHFFP